MSLAIKFMLTGFLSLLALELWCTYHEVRDYSVKFKNCVIKLRYFILLVIAISILWEIWSGK